jgi:hypothetical protein
LKWLWLNRVPKATWAGIITGLAVCLGAIGYTVWIAPPPATPVHPSHTLSLRAPSASASATPSVSPAPPPAPSAPAGLLKAYQVPHDGLLTNEYAYFDTKDRAAVRSADWEMTSGSLYGRGGAFWTGQPDECEPDAKSSTCTNSDVFRLDSKQKFGGSIRVSLSLLQLAEIHNTACEEDDSCWHGTHIWLRYQNQYNLYYASINRADGQVAIKRKVPCGDDNDGTYFVLGSYVPHDFHTNNWSHYEVTIQTNSDKSVTIKLYDTDTSRTQPVTTGTDRGGTNPSWTTSCRTAGHYSSNRYQPITGSGGIGIRGDYANFLFQDLAVSKL